MSFRPHPSALARPLILSAAAIGAFAFTGGVPALANHVSCGDRITADTKLDRNLVDCPDNGIVIGANGVTLDLDGHTIDGDGEFVDSCPGRNLCDVGVASDGHNRVTVKDGRIEQFVLGVGVFDAKGTHLRRLTATRNIGLGVGVFDARDAHLRRLTASHNVDSGIILVDAARSDLRRSSVFANGLDTDQAGMGLFESHDVNVRRTSLSGNGDIGVLAQEVSDIRLIKNKVADHPEVGILMEGDGNEVARNRLVRNEIGIAFDGSENAITRNHLVKAAGGSGSGFKVGIQFEGGHDTLIAHNKVRGALSEGILTGPSFGIHGEGTKLIGNHVRAAGRDGVRVGRTATDTLLSGNHVSGSGDDGIEVRRASTTLTGNRAADNGDLGIDAVKGVTDGGANSAGGNEGAHQCRNVLCG
jgi:parallel beta-helix repeat protein